MKVGDDGDARPAAAQTMTVGKLRELLGDRPDDAPVLVTWEGQLVWITPENVYDSADGVVILDADTYGSQRDKFEKASVRQFRS